MSITKTQQAWLESLAAAVLAGALAAALPYVSAGTPINGTLVATAALTGGAAVLQAWLRGLAQPGPQGPLAPAGTPEPPK